MDQDKSKKQDKDQEQGKVIIFPSGPMTEEEKRIMEEDARKHPEFQVPFDHVIEEDADGNVIIHPWLQKPENG